MFFDTFAQFLRNCTNAQSSKKRALTYLMIIYSVSHGIQQFSSLSDPEFQYKSVRGFHSTGSSHGCSCPQGPHARTHSTGSSHRCSCPQGPQHSRGSSRRCSCPPGLHTHPPQGLHVDALVNRVFTRTHSHQGLHKYALVHKVLTRTHTLQGLDIGVPQGPHAYTHSTGSWVLCRSCQLGCLAFTPGPIAGCLACQVAALWFGLVWSGHQVWQCNIRPMSVKTISKSVTFCRVEAGARP